MQEKITINRYTSRFRNYYFLALVTVLITFSVLGIKANFGVSIIILIFAAMNTTSLFVKENKRIPNKQEKQKLIKYSLSYSLAFSILAPIFMAVLTQGTESLKSITNALTTPELASIAAPIFIALILFSAFILYFIYSFIPKYQLKK